MSFAGSETDRLLSGLLMAGAIEAVDHQTARARVRSGDWVSTWLPWSSLSAGQVRRWRAPTVGEQVMVLSPSGQPEQGMILPGFYTTPGYDQPDNSDHATSEHMPDGAYFEYDWEHHRWLVQVPLTGELVMRVGRSFIRIADDHIAIVSPRIDYNPAARPKDYPDSLPELKPLAS